MRAAAGAPSTRTAAVRKGGLALLGTDSQKRAALPNPSTTRNRVQQNERKQRRIIIGDYSFERDSSGTLRYTEPSQDFLALLREDGSVEFESRAGAKGGICAIGLCVTAGGLRSAKERKRKRFNRVRIRFAPVPLGIAIQFGSTRGIPAKQLKFLRETFDARLEMRIKSMRKKRARYLRGLASELRRIWRTHPPKEARRIILARAFELDPPASFPEKISAKQERQLRALRAQEQEGVRSICEQVLAFVQRRHRSIQAGGFTDLELTKIKKHCAMIRGNKPRGK